GTYAQSSHAPGAPGGSGRSAGTGSRVCEGPKSHSRQRPVLTLELKCSFLAMKKMPSCPYQQDHLQIVVQLLQLMLSAVNGK
ncbi:unnamed protein product, partial [Symbiodinium microadriaticum]